MLRARNAAWVALFEIFQEIHPKKLIPEKDWRALSFTIEALREDNHREDWAQISGAFDAIDGNHKIAPAEEWRKLYDALDNLWQDERINDVTPQELEAHSGRSRDSVCSIDSVIVRGAHAERRIRMGRSLRRLAELGSRNLEVNAGELLATIKKEVASFCNGKFHDDFTLVVVAVK